MNVYRLELNDVDDFVPELAEQLEIGYQNELGEFSLQIPASLGNGHVYGINFPNGIGLYTYKCSFKEKHNSGFAIRSLNPCAYSTYCLAN